ncbi:hypothetical protein [Actinoplanes sp. NPDC049681]|uniref:NucA/NucB deoxyribonuclease domain-containing protein n=1 Tax=Actinoplanes sp. NPDC049681 TaxID=3363905 RepID=UPI0037A6F86D
MAAAMLTSPASAAPIPPPAADPGRIPAGGGQPLAKPVPTTLKSAEPSCSAPKDGAQLCIGEANPARGRGASPELVAWPDICALSGRDGVIYADSRVRECREKQGLLLQTTRTSGGVTTVTGQVYFNFLDLVYSDRNSGLWTHQTGFYSTSGWGDAAGATVAANGTAGGSCVLQSQSFPTSAIMPVQVVRAGESRIQTAATPLGSIGHCTTMWSWAFAVAGYNPTTTTTGMQDVRCDNASGESRGRPARVGCVVWWYPAPVVYSSSRYPSLTSHVSRAQASGLPGRDVTAPLRRSTNPADESLNRSRACGDAPSIPNKSCDEYPLATTLNGLAFGGTRRTFSGCNINAPTGVTGPSGASACMITASENSAQGGIMSGFYYDERVLHADPYIVSVGP